MPEQVTLIEPAKLQRNPENPRLIFHQAELEELQLSIAKQGILVPLTVYRDQTNFYILDGERRWRCSLKIGLAKVPVIVQPKPDRLQNLMMMFAIHNARRDWDPLPTALKLEDLEKEFQRIQGRIPKESELAGIASLSRGEVRRLKKLLALPKEYREELLKELEKPRHLQRLTVDQVLESTKAAESLRKRGVVTADGEEKLRRELVEKFREGITDNTVAPRKLVRLARAVEREEVPQKTAERIVARLEKERNFTIDEAFSSTVEEADVGHTIEQLAERIAERLTEHRRRKFRLTAAAKQALTSLSRMLQNFLSED